MSPTQRTLKYFRDQGYLAEVVEHWNQWTKQRKDLLNIIDIVALGNEKIVGIQACAGASFSARYKKIMAEPKAKKWLECKGTLLLMAWRKIRKEGTKKQMIWQPRIHEFKLIDFAEKELEVERQ